MASVWKIAANRIERKFFPARLNNLKFFPAITTGNGRSLRTANTGQHESFYAVNAGIEKAGWFTNEPACFFSSPIFFCLLLEKRIQKAENKKIKRIWYKNQRDQENMDSRRLTCGCGRLSVRLQHTVERHRQTKERNGFCLPRLLWDQSGEEAKSSRIMWSSIT